MKRALLLTAIAVTAWQPSFAAGLTLESCKGIEKGAAAIMTLRQDGRPMSDLVSVTRDTGAVDQLYRAMIQDAYGQPRYSLPDNQRRAVEDFRNDVFAHCYQEATK